MGTQTLWGELTDKKTGKVVEIVEVYVEDLPDVVTQSSTSIEEVVQTTPSAMCRTKTTHLTITQKMHRITEKFYTAVEGKDNNVGWKIFGGFLAVVVVIAIAVTAPVSIPTLVVVTGTGAAATGALTTLGTIVIGVAILGAGAGLTVEFSEYGELKYKPGVHLRTVGPTDQANGDPTSVAGTPTYSSLHPCEEQ